MIVWHAPLVSRRAYVGANSRARAVTLAGGMAPRLMCSYSKSASSLPVLRSIRKSAAIHGAPAVCLGHGVPQLLQHVEDGEIPGRYRNGIALVGVAKAVHVEHAVPDPAGQHEMRPAIEQ